MPAAIASECVADLEGAGKFWDFMGKFKDEIMAGDSIDVRAIAVSLGANGAKFDECYNSGKFSEKINENYNNGIEAGLQGTPYSVIFSDGNPVGVVDGAYPIDDVKAAIEPYL
jgi:protein-disulfide isomerase